MCTPSNNKHLKLVIMKAILNYLRPVTSYLKEYFKDIKLSEITWNSLTKAASQTAQNV